MHARLADLARWLRVRRISLTIGLLAGFALQATLAVLFVASTSSRTEIDWTPRLRTDSVQWFEMSTPLMRTRYTARWIEIDPTEINGRLLPQPRTDRTERAPDWAAMDREAVARAMTSQFETEGIPSLTGDDPYDLRRIAGTDLEPEVRGILLAAIERQPPVLERSAGFPLHAVSRVRVEVGAELYAEPAALRPPSLGAAAFAVPCGRFGRFWIDPLRLVVDMLLSMAAFVGVSELVFAVRCRIRSRNGRCCWCAHTLARDQAICPECGHQERNATALR